MTRPKLSTRPVAVAAAAATPPPPTLPAQARPTTSASTTARPVPPGPTTPDPATPQPVPPVADQAAHLVADLLARTGLDPAPSCGEQAMGDLLILPWLACMGPDVRAAHVAAARPLPATGGRLLGSHLLITETGPPACWTPSLTGPGSTLGVLVVPDGGVVRMDHDPADARPHDTLRVGPGVYAVRRQREHTRERIVLVSD